MTKAMRERLLATTIIAGAAIAASPAGAQSGVAAPTTTVSAAQAGAGPIEGQTGQNATVGGTDASAGGDIVVTGSRIPTPNLSGASPVTVLTSQEIKLTGTTRVEDLLNQLPQAFGDQGGNVSNGSTGTSTANLRNLGGQRTLVLINGRRLVPGDPSDSSADLNFIPGALVKRIDVLTGGASSVYGADAVGGVINFVMDSEFSGFKLDGQYSFFQHDNNSNVGGLRQALAAQRFTAPQGSGVDGGTVDVTAVVGGGFDDNRGHVTAYIGYRRLTAVTQGARDYSSCGLNARATLGADGRNFNCGGSFSSNNFVTSAAGGGSTTYQLGAGRTFVPGSNVFNFGPTNYYQRPDERYTAGFFAHYDIDDAFRPYVEGMFMDDRTRAQIAPSGNFGNTLSINCDNPLLSAQQLGIVCDAGNLLDATGTAVNNGGGAPARFVDTSNPALTYNRAALQVFRRNVEGGPRVDDLQHTSYRIVTGAKGDVAKGISYDAYFQYGRTNFQETYLNDVSISRLGRSLDVVTGPNGTPTCRSALDGSDANCVPYDIFGGGVSQAAINYLGVPGFQRGQTSEQVFNASITALLGEYGIQSPLSNEGVALNVGYEYRKERLELNTDLAFQTGDLAGQGAATLPVSGNYRVNEGFGELRVPLIHDNFIYDLSVTGGYRYSNYELGNGRSFSTDTYKGEVQFAPIRDVTLRGSYNRAVRAPNLQELFAPQRVVLNGALDPCANNPETGAPDASAAACALTGVSAAQYGTIASNPANQYNGLIGGNANLNPEKADTYTVGAVIRPGFLPKFALTVDAFRIKVKQTIRSIGQDTTIQTCIATGDPTFCGLINRDQFGSLWRTPNGFIIDTNQNLGSVKTQGIDVGASYAQDVGKFGSLGFNLAGTYLDKFKTDNGVSDPYDCAGRFGLQCGTPAPKWRHRASMTYTSPIGVSLTGRWRYFGVVRAEGLANNETLAPGSSTGTQAAVLSSNRKINDQSYFDLAMTASFADHYTFRLGVNNLLDRDPPLVGSQILTPVFGNGNTFPNVYDALGRYIYAGVTLDF